MPVKKVKSLETKPAKTPVAKKSALTVDVYDTKGKVVETLELSKEIFGKTPNQKLVAQAVRVYLANQRAGSANTKTRGQVKGSTRKIYKQKGTGRARHGSVRAPIFVHGGIAFGPHAHDFSLKMPKAMRKAALFSVLSAKQQVGAIKILKDLSKIEPKTKHMAEVLEKLSLNPKKNKTLLVLASPTGVDNVVKATRNIEGVSYTFGNLLNTYETFASKTLLFTKDALATLEQTFLKE